jgi:23S rRNA pseudouridine1911/1915/1917 synthase
MISYYTVQPEEAGERIDTFLARKSERSRSQIQRLILKKNVLVNEKNINQDFKIRAADIITVTFTDEHEDILIPEALDLPILYKDRYVAVVDKPAGMVVYPAAGHRSGTLMNALSYYSDKLARVGLPLRPGVVHRLDKETSGVMIVAVDDTAYYNLVEQFRRRTITRRYAALIYGSMKGEKGEIKSKIGRSASDRKKMSTRSRSGKEAITRWKVLQKYHGATMVDVKLSTGRTHQIRVHFAAEGHPVLGDRTYGRIKEIRAQRQSIHFPRQMLHAAVLGFTHPSTGKYMEFSSSLPADMQTVIKELQGE